jgi:hypothetical protein
VPPMSLSMSAGCLDMLLTRLSLARDALDIQTRKTILGSQN